MRILKVLIIIIAVFAIILLGGILVLPSDAHVERSTVIDAPVTEVFATLNSFKEFNEWSPWAAIDPENTNYTFEGPDSGIGAKMSWTSTNDNVGAGSQEIVESNEGSMVKVEMYFEGYEDPAYASYILEDESGSTRVTWTFDGKFKGFSKYFGLMMDGMLGPQYEEGLASLKEHIEAG